MDRWRSSGFWQRDVLPLPLIRGSTCPKSGPTMRSDATKRASRTAKGSLRPKANWLWKSLSRPVAMECALVGSGPMRATAVVRTFYLLWPMHRHTFLIDVHKSFVIYEVDPQLRIQEPSSRGRKARRLVSAHESLSVEEFVESCSTKDWRLYNVRETTRGSLKLRVLRKSVYVWDKQSEQARRYELLVTENFDGQDRKYSLTNPKPSTSTQRLSWMQRQRYWVERCFEDGKSQCGMADYQLRLWNAWHHHMALVMMAMLFMLTERLRMKDQCPLLSCADIERLLAAFLPRRDASPEQVLSHMNRRHQMRRRAIESHAKRNAERRLKVTQSN